MCGDIADTDIAMTNGTCTRAAHNDTLFDCQHCDETTTPVTQVKTHMTR